MDAHPDGVPLVAHRDCVRGPGVDHRVRGELGHQRDRVVAGSGGIEIGQRLPDETSGRRDTVRDRGKRHPRGGERSVRVWRWCGGGPDVNSYVPARVRETLIVRRRWYQDALWPIAPSSKRLYHVELGPRYWADHPRATLGGSPAHESSDRHGPAAPVQRGDGWVVQCWAPTKRWCRAPILDGQRLPMAPGVAQ